MINAAMATTAVRAAKDPVAPISGTAMGPAQAGKATRLPAESETISRAIEIRDGVILNQDVLRFQQRKPEYPHLPVPA